MKRAGFSSNGTLNCEFKFSTFSCTKRRAHMRDSEEKGYSQVLVQALAPAVRLELLPKSAIDIYINVLENDGTSSCLAAAIVAASTALADAGIEMLDQVTACSAVRLLYICFIRNVLLIKRKIKNCILIYICILNKTGTFQETNYYGWYGIRRTTKGW